MIPSCSKAAVLFHVFSAFFWFYFFFFYSLYSQISVRQTNNKISLVNHSSLSSLPSSWQLKPEPLEIEHSIEAAKNETLNKTISNNEEKSKQTLTTNRVIMFIESDMSRTELSERQMCAIESTAKHNPNVQIVLYTLRAQLNSNASFLLNYYPNIRIERINPENEINVSSVLQFWNNSGIRTSNYSHVHSNEFLRLLLLWKHGGVFSDLDIVTLKSFDPLFSSKKSGFGCLLDQIEFSRNAFLLFAKKKHSYLDFLIDRYMKHYDPTSWAKNGPFLMKRTLVHFCQIRYYLQIELFGFKQSIFSKNSTHRCDDLVLFPESFFYPITRQKHNDYKRVFWKNSSLNKRLNKSVKDSYVVHLNNRHDVAKIDDGSFYTYLAEKNCEHTYYYVKSHSLTFAP